MIGGNTEDMYVPRRTPRQSTVFDIYIRGPLYGHLPLPACGGMPWRAPRREYNHVDHTSSLNRINSEFGCEQSEFLQVFTPYLLVVSSTVVSMNV